MPWSTSVTSSCDIVAAQAAVTLTDNGDGEIVMFGGDNHTVVGAPPHLQPDSTPQCAGLSTTGTGSRQATLRLTHIAADTTTGGSNCLGCQAR
jgi:hypothetical protein